MSNTGTILITGACGQIGSELTSMLRSFYGASSVIASDIKDPSYEFKNGGPYEKIDVLDKQALVDIMQRNSVNQVYHLAAMLSATAEKNPKKAWRLNTEGLFNILEIAETTTLNKLFWPSSIAVFGPGTPRENTPQNTVMDPDTIYGITKLLGERWCQYYHEKKQIDIRSVRYPGLISHISPPGGGTTDYAIDIFYEAVRHQSYECFLEGTTRLPMMYMPDAIRGTIELMDAPADQLTVRSSYNFSAMSFSPIEIAEEIKNSIPEFQITFQPDYRQSIAKSWPESIDDKKAREDWGWKHEYGLEAMTKDMLENIGINLQQQSLT